MSEEWRRHDLLRVEPSAWSRVLSRQSVLAAVAEVAQWAALGRPVIVRRPAALDTVDVVPVALSLPLAFNKLRVCLQVAPAEISKRMPGQMLRASLDEAPLAWQGTAAKLLALADETGVEPLIFGSLLWQRLTRLPYLTATSDLDLLWPVTDLDCASWLVSRLDVIERNSPVRLDGELILPDGGGVHWRELASGASEVVVKTMAGVQLRPASALFNVPACEAEPNINAQQLCR